MKRIAIIGGGASGIVAAIQAAQMLADRGKTAEVVLLERMPRIGKKILATGNGRCNLTNSDINSAHYRTGDVRSLESVLQGFGAQEILDYFKRLGLWCAEREGGRIYPLSNQASSVMDVLLAALDRQGVKVICNWQAEKISRRGDKFLIQPAAGQPLSAERVIIAAGGHAAPTFGTDGAGFALAKMLGHSVSAFYPALVPLKTAGELTKGLKGIRAMGSASLWADGSHIAQQEGEIQFAEYGLSGIPIMQLSNVVGTLPGKKLTIKLDLVPQMDQATVLSEIRRRVKMSPSESLETLLNGTVHKRLGYAAMKAAGLAPLSRENRSLSLQEQEKLATALKEMCFPITGTLGWAQAQSTGGGIPLNEINPRTMESKKAPGLFLSGELLDVVGECGGFNLHWAWVTGVRAGMAAANSL